MLARVLWLAAVVSCGGSPAPQPPPAAPPLASVEPPPPAPADAAAIDSPPPAADAEVFPPVRS